METKRQAVLFDLDGTLLDSLGDLADSMNAVLREDGLPTHDVDAFRYFIGDGVPALVKRSLPPGQDEASLRHYLHRYRASYSRRWHLSRPFPEIPALLDELESRRTGLAVVSNKPHPFTQKCVDQLFAEWEWDAVVGQSENGARKPDPRSSLEIAVRLGVPSRLCWFVGDSDVDMQTGLNAGMNAVGVAWGFRPESELRDAGAHHVIASPKDLLTLMEADR